MHLLKSGLFIALLAVNLRGADLPKSFKGLLIRGVGDTSELSISLGRNWRCKTAHNSSSLVHQHCDVDDAHVLVHQTAEPTRLNIKKVDILESNSYDVHTTKIRLDGTYSIYQVGQVPVDTLVHINLTRKEPDLLWRGYLALPNYGIKQGLSAVAR